MKKSLTLFLRRFASSRGWGYGLFWSWNLIFLAFMLLGFAPRMLPEMLTAVRAGEIPADFLVYAIILTLIPVIVVILGFTILRRSPGRLFSLGYGVEGPLMLLLAIRFFAVREMTLAMALLLSIAGLGIATLLWQILDQKIDDRGALLAHLRLAGLTLLLITGLYAGVWLAFYAVPMAVVGWNWFVDTLVNLPRFLSDLGDELWRLFTGEWSYIPFVLLGFILMIYTATLFVLMPLAVPVLCIRAWQAGLRVLASRYGPLRAVLLTAVVLLACAALLAQTNRQPQQEAFALLETLPANPAEARALLDKTDTIRAGLLNAYLSPFRYFSAVGEVRHISDIYQDALKLSAPEAGRVQTLYETVARPVLYLPVHPPETTDPNSLNRWDSRAFREESQEAAELYETFFDQTIIEGERETIVQAVRSTWSVDRAQTAWQAVDDREVHLLRQELNLTEHGDWAEVELYEVYQNRTAQRQEVVYYFSLPESAVITGVWLGNSPNRSERFDYRVSPRGAAQAIYRNEVRWNMDPALVEQIGPRQYRLRIFPIEPQRQRWDQEGIRSTIEAGPPLYMWLTWRVLARDHAWPLPRLAEKRNVYWDGESIRLLNGQPMTTAAANWLPEAVAVSGPVELAPHRVDFPNGETVLIRPVTTDELADPSTSLKTGLPANLHLAVVLDRSRSMAKQAAQVEAAFDRLARLEAEIDVYLTASKYRGEESSRLALADFDPDSILYYGGQNAAELLTQFDTLRGNQSYDAVLVLTDGTGYELGEGEVRVPRPTAPVWMVHLGGDFPLGYDDPTLEAIQASGGGVTGSLDEALTRLAIALAQSDSDEALADIIDGYTWLTLPTRQVEGDPVAAADDDFAAFAARRLILAAMQRRQAELNQLETLDQLHAIAIEHSIVTPYSSMIVLVTQDQERRLDRLEAEGDRFQREYEEVGETNPDLTGVPEPEEWLLLALVVGMLGWYLRSRFRQITGRGIA
jgi:putative PEP-CTERM system integral membrane protein